MVCPSCMARKRFKNQHLLKRVILLVFAWGSVRSDAAAQHVDGEGAGKAGARCCEHHVPFIFRGNNRDSFWEAQRPPRHPHVSAAVCGGDGRTDRWTDRRTGAWLRGHLRPCCRKGGVGLWGRVKELACSPLHASRSVSLFAVWHPNHFSHL